MGLKRFNYISTSIFLILGLSLFFFAGCRAPVEEPPEPQPVKEEVEVEIEVPEPEEEIIENLYVSTSERFPNYSFICPQGWDLTVIDDGAMLLAQDANQALMVLVEEDADLEAVAEGYLNVTGELEDVSTTEEEVTLGGTSSKLIGYQFVSGLEAQKKQVDLLAFHEKGEYLYILKYMAADIGLEGARDNFLEIVSTFSWEDDLETTLEVSRDEKNSLNILILGDDSFHDRPGGRVSARTDINMLLHIDLDNWEAVIVTIPRDLWVKVPGRGETKINAANAIGGPELTVETFELFSGLEIDSYMITDMDGFIELIDFLGGVTVEVEENLADGFSGCYLDKGVHHLDGVQALALSRNRQRPGGAFAREEESAKMIVALYEQQTTLDKILKLPAFINHLLNYTWTDMDFRTVLKIIPALGKIDAEDIEIMAIPSWPEMIGNVSAVVHDPDATSELFEDLKNLK